MKFIENWLKEYCNFKYNIKKITKILNFNGFETKFYSLINKIKKKKLFIYKIKKYKILKNKKYGFFYIKKKKIYIKYINNLNNKTVFFYKKELKNNKNFYFLLKKKINKKKYIIILYNNEKSIKKITSKIKISNILDIITPLNRIDCNNILGLSKEISIITKNKFSYPKFILNKKKKKYKKDFDIKISYNIKKYIINYNLLILKNVIPYKYYYINKIKKRLKIIGLLNKNIFINIMKYITIEYGQIINIIDADLILNKKILIYSLNKKISLFNNEKYFSIKNNNIIIYNNYDFINKKYLPNKKTKNILIGAPLLTENFIFKINKNNKYISNFNEKIQIKALKKTEELINKIYFYKKKNKYIYNYIKILNKNEKIKILYKNIYNLLGLKIKKNIIIKILNILEFKIIKKNYFFLYIKKPKWRQDLKIEQDIIEEIIKIYGYKNILCKPIKTKILLNKENNKNIKIKKIKKDFINLGYKEIINFSFSNLKTEKIFSNKKKNYINLYNPISKETSILRTSLLPGLFNTLLYNIKRQNNSIKIFEIGKCFFFEKNKIKEKNIISAIIYGYKYNFH